MRGTVTLEKSDPCGAQASALSGILVSVRTDAERSLERIGKMALVTESQVQRDLSQRKPAMFQEFLCQLKAARLNVLPRGHPGC